MTESFVLVSGGSGSIGSSIVQRFLKNGHKVIVFDKKQLPESLRGSDCLFFKKVDLSKASSIHSACDELVKKKVKISSLVYCSGINEEKNIFDITERSWKKELDVNLTGAVFLSKYAWPLLVNKASISLITSIKAFENTRSIGYSASKAALNQIVTNLANSFSSKKVRVNAIAPGYIESRMLKGKNLSQLANRCLLKRIGTPEDVSKVAYFLAFEGTFINGQTIRVDGGI
jgi:NAD(P)-dependent dehydrogenase (short-subunit alcohol dehydrogenase family)